MNLLILLDIAATEIMLIAVVALVLFGGEKIPELMRSLGKGMREFNNAKESVKREITKNIDDVNDQIEK